MDFDHSPKVQALQKKVAAFMERHVYPSEKRYREELDAGGRWQPPPVIDELKKKARTRGAVEPVPAGIQARRRTDQPRIRAAV